MERNSIIDAQEELKNIQYNKLISDEELDPGKPPPLPDDPEWEAYVKMMEEEENADPDLHIAKREAPSTCIVPNKA